MVIFVQKADCLRFARINRYYYFAFAFWIVSTIYDFDRLDASEESFHFCAIGDMPYYLPEDYNRFDNVIDVVNSEAPSFTVHVGDTKSGSSPCSDESAQRTWESFSRFEHPLIYTPGDNEWTDCHRKGAGSMDPLERLSAIRARFFSDGGALGRHGGFQLTAQSEDPKWIKFTENQTWKRNGVVFATLHIVGSNNNDQKNVSGAVAEFRERDAANKVWLARVFDEAISVDASGVAIFIHGNPFGELGGRKGGTGYERFLNQLRDRTTSFEKPVLIVHGDSHYFRVDKPLMRKGTARDSVENLTRLEVFGARNMHAVRVDVDPASRQVFRISQLIVEKNRR